MTSQSIIARANANFIEGFWVGMKGFLKVVDYPEWMWGQIGSK
jgi:hypothetical protein